MPAAPPSEPQLSLPGVPVAPGSVPSIPRADRVYVNRHLELTSIAWVGFDMDYTLAIYDQAAMDALSIELTVERLIRRGYPASLAALRYDTAFPIRGLLVDKRHGNVLKMDRYKGVRLGYHGLRRLDTAEITRLYHDRRIRPHTPRYHWIDTLFGLCEVSTYAAVIEALEEGGTPVDYDRLFADIRESIDEAHRDGTVYAAVTADIDRFVERDPLLARTLHKLRSAGKRTFLLTNSPADYTDRLLTHLLDGAMPEYPSWRHYFDVVIAAARKPTWFQDGGPLLLGNGAAPHRPVEGSLERLVVYEGGNLRDFEERVGVVGSRVLYVGDHVYGDMLRSKKDSSWRTAMIIPELGAELTAHETSAGQVARLRELDGSRDRLEDELRYHQARFKHASRTNGGAVGPSGGPSEAERVDAKRAIERVRGELRALAAEHQALTEEVDRAFHPYWGSLLKERNEMSSFGLQVDTYADLYMRRVSSLFHYSPAQFFRSPHDTMPHER